MTEETTAPGAPIYGRNLLASVEPSLFDSCVVICAPEAWELVRTQFPTPPRSVIAPTSMEQSVIETQLDTLPGAEVVFGIGGGSACDAAKLAAWRSGARLVLLPSVLSVDAPFTTAVGVRVGSRVRYIGKAVPELLLVDFDLLQRSPPRLNRAGIGDILSIHTALWDWDLARRETGERYDAGAAFRSKALLERLLAAPVDLRDCTEDGLRLIADLYVEEVALCDAFGNSRPEEGSEHYFAYCLESLTRKSYLHGELIAMAVVLTSLYQEQETESLVAFLRASGVGHRPSEVGVSPQEIRDALVRLPSYLEDETQLPYGIFHHRGVTEEQAGLLTDALVGAVGA